MIRDSRNLGRPVGKQHAKGGTTKKTRRVKAAGNSSQGRGHAIKSRPGSKFGMPTSEDADAEEALPDGKQSDARAPAKPQRNTRRTSDVAAGKKKQTRTTSPAATTAKRKAKKAAKAGPAARTGGKRPPGSKPKTSTTARARARA